MLKIKQQRRVDVKRQQTAVPAIPPQATVVSVVHGTLQVTVLFGSTVVPSPTTWPSGWTFNGEHITGMLSATPASITYSVGGTVAASDPYVITYGDPSVRTVLGGTVNAATGTMT
jgi:hypothetical protein